MTNRDRLSVIRVAVAAPIGTRCGIADYSRLLTQALPRRFEVSLIDLPESSSGRSEWRSAAAQADALDLVHVHFEYALFGSVKPYRNRFLDFMSRLRLPAVVTLHDLLPALLPRWRGWPPYGARDLLRDAAYLPFFKGWERSHYDSADHWLVHTREHEEAVAAAAGSNRVSRWLHPVPPTDFVWQPCCGTELSARGARLVSPGFIKSHKGYSRFVGTVARLPAVRWTLAGGPQHEKDERYVAGLGDEIRSHDVGARVEITGYLKRADLESRTAGSTLAVFPFDKVGGSGSIALAIALGMPIVATDLKELQELVAQGAGLELLPSAEPGVWADRIADLLASPDRLCALAEANRRFSREHSYSQAGARLGALFEDLLR